MLDTELLLEGGVEERQANVVTEEGFSYSGSGLNDFTRIAGANPEMWWAIFSLNEAGLAKAMDNFQQTFSKLRSAILKRDQQTALEIMNSAYDRRKSI